jgi:TonB family protein
MKSCTQIEYHPTILSSRGLLPRLAVELRFTFEEIRHAWPELKRDPIGFGKLTLLATGTLLRSCLRTPTLASGLAGVFVVLTAVMFVALMDSVDDDRTVINENDTLLVEMLTIPTPDQSSLSTGNGIGSGSQGRIGFDKRKGEGSEAKPKRARGGGGGGLNQQLVAQQGKPPAPSEIPATIPQLPPARKQALPMAGIDIDPAVWKNLPFPRYGDPRSTSTALSNGPGDRGGMGTGIGTGVGEGKGDGFGPGSDGNIGDGTRGLGSGGMGGGPRSASGSDPNRIIPASMAAQRARVLSKPEPQYTEEARRNQISGTVVLRVVFSRSGEVTNIRAIHTLPFGLTEKAIAAARQIRFLPAIQDNRPVSVYMQLEYNFNLY